MDVKQKRLVGIVSIGDVVKHRLMEMEREFEALQDYIQRPSGHCQPMKIADGAWIMSRLPLHDDTLAPAFLSGSPYTHYPVVCHEDVWFIKFQTS